MQRDGGVEYGEDVRDRELTKRISVLPVGRSRGEWETGDGWGCVRVKVAESISPAIIGSAGVRKTPLINTSSLALDNLRPRAAE